MEIEVRLLMQFKGKLFRTNIVMLRAERMSQRADWFETTEKSEGLEQFKEILRAVMKKITIF